MMLMAEVDPVEVADGHDGAPQAGGDIFAAPDHVHKSLFYASLICAPTIASIALISSMNLIPAAASFLLDNGRTLSVDNPRIADLENIAEVAELVDALGSGSSGCTPVRVQIPASAP